jgi:hypothetical protein
MVTNVGASGEASFYHYTTTPVPVPLFSATTSPVPSTENFYSFSQSLAGPDAFGVYTLNLNFQSPAPQVTRTRFAEVWMYNYRGAALYENMGLVSVCKVPQSIKTITYKLEKDGGGHNVTFYLAECNALRMRRFAKPITSFLSSTTVGGFP